MNVDPSGLEVNISLPKDYFNGDFPTVAEANANLTINGGSGRDFYVNASRLMVEPNGSKNWTISTKGLDVLPVRVIGYRNDLGNWINSRWSTRPTQQDHGYWVYGELALSRNFKLYPDTYNFEQHEINSNSSISANMSTIGRNLLTEIGAINAVGFKSFDFKSLTFQAEGFNINFFNKPYCLNCPAAPSR